MTTDSTGTHPEETGAAGTEPPSPWRGVGPELAIAAGAVTATALAALAVAGWPGLAAVAAGAAVLSLVVVRGLAPRSARHSARTAAGKPSARAMSGYAQRRFAVGMGVRDLAFYESELRPALEHLLAARLAERHGINVYTDPGAARNAFCQTARDEDLWRWIDPARDMPARSRARSSAWPKAGSGARPGRPVAGSASGIPRHVLTRLVDRLENL